MEPQFLADFSTDSLTVLNNKQPSGAKQRETIDGTTCGQADRKQAKSDSVDECLLAIEGIS